MKRIFLILILGGWLSTRINAECCFLSGARTLSSLQAIQRYDLALATSVQDYENGYNLSLQASSSARLTPVLELFGRVPLVQHSVEYSRRDQRTGPGDFSLGLRMVLFRSLFMEDLFPTTSLVVSTKVPTGAQDYRAQNLFQSRSGNGLFEPLIGVSFSKDYYDWLGTLDISYTRLQGSIEELALKDNQINLTETLGYTVIRDWQVGAGSNQIFSFGREVNHSTLADSNGRSVNVFSYLNYLPTAFTTVGVQLDWTVESLTKNYPVSRTASLSLRYGFY